MKCLVIPDVHLKPWIFHDAMALMSQGIADAAVCLMDIADDWEQQDNLELYAETYNSAIQFAKAFPDTKFIWGNHDCSYLWNCYESGFSSRASLLVLMKLTELMSTLPENNPIKYIQRIDDVLFSHGGLTEFFAREHIPPEEYNEIDAVINTINKLGRTEMWTDCSPIWARPQHSEIRLYKPHRFLQVVGHTPVKVLKRKGSLISTDLFSTYTDGTPIGSQELLLIDTVSWEYKGICLNKTQ